MNEENKTNINGQSDINTNPTMPTQPQPIQGTPVQTTPATNTVDNTVVQTTPATNAVDNNIQPQTTTASETKTVEYVSPLNTTEVVKTKNLEVPKTIIEKPLPNQPILATTPVISNEPISAPTTPVEPSEQPKKKAKNNNLLIILVAIVMVAVIGAVMYFTFFHEKGSTTPVDENPQQQEEPAEDEELKKQQEKLTNIVNIFKENDDYETLNIEATVKDNSISIKFKNSTDNVSYDFVLDGDILTTTCPSDDFVSALMFAYIVDAVGVINGNKEGDTIKYLNSIDILTEEIDGITITEVDENLEISIDITKKIDTSSVYTLYFRVEDFEDGLEFINNNGSFQTSRGNILFYKSGYNDEAVITFAETPELSSLTYQSIISLIEVMYPDELEDFKAAYDQISNAEFGRYKIVVNPDLTGIVESIYGNYEDEYQFIQITIDKSI